MKSEPKKKKTASKKKKPEPITGHLYGVPTPKDEDRKG